MLMLESLHRLNRYEPRLVFKQWRDTPWYYTRVPDWLLEDAEKFAKERREFKRRRTRCVPLFQTDALENETIGILGELVSGYLFAKNLDLRLLDTGDGGADFYLRLNYRKHVPIDVKTAARNVLPQPHFNAVVERSQLERKKGNEILFFFSYTKPSRLIFALGYLSVAEFRSMARLIPRGSKLESGSIAPADFYAVRIRQLRRPADLIERSLP
ncbi:hypothetical protein [Candidatus Pyrohabitans sp.]